MVNGLEVSRVAALADPTDVVEDPPVRDWPKNRFVDDAVNAQLPAIYATDAMPVAVDLAEPEPVIARDLDLGREVADDRIENREAHLLDRASSG